MGSRQDATPHGRWMKSTANHRGRGALRVGVLDLLVDEAPSRHWLDLTYRAVFKKQYARIMPQAVAVW